jgi:hypothetical protein
VGNDRGVHLVHDRALNASTNSVGARRWRARRERDRGIRLRRKPESGARPFANATLGAHGTNPAVRSRRAHSESRGWVGRYDRIAGICDPADHHAADADLHYVRRRRMGNGSGRMGRRDQRLRLPRLVLWFHQLRRPTTGVRSLSRCSYCLRLRNRQGHQWTMDNDGNCAGGSAQTLTFRLTR